MNYMMAVRELMSMTRWTYSGLARAMGVSSGQYVRNLLMPFRKNKKTGEIERNGIVASNLIRMVEAMGGRVLIEWRDPRDYRSVYRWRIDNSDPTGEPMPDETYLYTGKMTDEYSARLYFDPSMKDSWPLPGTSKPRKADEDEEE